MNFSREEKMLLLDLFHLYAPSGKETPVLEFIKSVLTKNGTPFKQDDKGNIYCINHKGLPLLSAHTDCVGGPESGAYVKLIDIYPYGDSEVLKGVGNIGGDDKCGVFLILLYILSGRPINAIFSICEEIGGMDGIKHLLPQIKDDEIFKSIPYCLVLDRKNPGDIICKRNDYGSQKFEDALYAIGKDYGYEPVLGGCSDMNTIKEYMNGCNLSTAYYNPHSTTEWVDLDELHNTWEYVQDLIDNMPRDIPLEKPEPPKWSGSTWNGSNYSGYGNSIYADYGKSSPYTTPGYSWRDHEDWEY